MDFWEALGSAGSLVDMVTAEVGAVFEGLGNGEVGEVLVAESWCGIQVKY